MKRPDQDYFLARERIERAAAKSATCPNARRVHQELAQNYAALARPLMRERLTSAPARDAA
jgi:hypothetical protein